MKVKELIKLLKECNQEKEVYYNSYCEGIDMDVSGVSEGKHYLTKEEVVYIDE